LNTVIERRGRIERDQRRPVNAAAYNVPDAATRERECNQRDKTGEAHRQADAVRDTVGYLFYVVLIPENHG
jgi:hypothetical protein